MIIKKIWITGYKYKGNYKVWRGWFLFGFIPLYIEQIVYQ